MFFCLFFFKRAFHVRFGRFERNTCFRGNLRQWSVFPLAFKMSRIYFMCFSVFPGLVGQEVILPACHRVSQRKKRWLLQQHTLPLTCLLPAEHIISHHNSGLLLQIQQSAWPGAPEHSDRYQTRDGWHTTRILTVSPFSLFICRHGYHTKCKAGDACYRWQRTVPVDGTCICLPAWLADSRSTAWAKPFSASAATTKPSPCLYASLQMNPLMHSWFCKACPLMAVQSFYQLWSE